MRKSGQVVLAVLLLVLLVSFNVQAAEKWTAEQKTVWAVEEKLWSLNKPTDMDEILSYYHPDYAGWGYESPIPYGKESVGRWVPFMLGERTVQVYEITPVTIQVHGNWAFVHYFYSMVTKNSKGETKSSDGRWTDILMKENGKWLFIGDQGGKTSKE